MLSSIPSIGMNLKQQKETSEDNRKVFQLIFNSAKDRCKTSHDLIQFSSPGVPTRRHSLGVFMRMFREEPRPLP